MSGNKLTITVSGTTNSGKSALIHLIKEALKREDVKYKLDKTVLVDFGDEQDFDVAIDKRIFGDGDILIRNKADITIVEIKENNVKLDMPRGSK